jgi:hypothetical protein
MSKLNFFERAAKFGHSADALKAGHDISSEISVPNLDELKKLLDDGSSAEEKSSFAGSLGAAPNDSDPQSGLLSRVNAHIFGNAPLSADDEAMVKQAFPLTVLTLSAENKTYPKGENCLGKSQLIINCNYGTVTMDDQSYVTVYNSTLNYTMDTLVRNGKPPAQWGDFNILGTTGTTGGVGDGGAKGGTGSTGKGGNCSSAGIAGSPGEDGKKGDDGKEGGVGNTGGTGLPSMAATIRINNEIKGTNSVIIYSCSGAGGQGGTGGTGGEGGKGGDGGDGATCGCTGSACGNGVNGGAGGTGGTGGRGGDGIDGQGKINIFVQKKFSSYIQKVYGDAKPGQGGTGGTGGTGGGPGYRGRNGKHNSGGSNGNSGGPGNKGNKGGAGNYTGKAAEIIVQYL